MISETEPYYVHAEFTLHSNVKTIVKSGFKTEEEAKEFKKGIEEEFFKIRKYEDGPKSIDFGDGGRNFYMDFDSVECFEVTVMER